MTSVLFRVDAGREWGLSFGHLYRCLALAEELRSRENISLSFLCRDIPEAIELITRNGYEVMSLPLDCQSTTEKKLIESKSIDILIIDLVKIPEEQYHLYNTLSCTVICIDDYGDRRLPGEYLFNGGIAQETHSYPETSRQKIFCGTDYCVLSSEYIHLEERDIRPVAERLLVSFGGSDPAGLTVRVAEVLRTSPFKLHFVLGPGFIQEEELRKILDGRDDFEIKRNVPSLKDEMLHADFALCAAGRTAYELAATGTPSVLVPSIEHEEMIAQAFMKQGTTQVITQNHLKKLPEYIQSLADDQERRVHMYEAGRKLIDGKGTARIVDLILSGQ